MSKNITIQEGGVARTLSGVEKIVTNVVGGGTQNWVPEDEAANYVTTGELSVSENGTYYASDDGYIGFSKVEVDTPSRLTSKTITENGTYDASDDGYDGFSSVDVNVEGSVPTTLIEKQITENGEYVARDDDADGYSKIIVNVQYPHGKVVVPGINHAKVSQRISTSDFLEDFDEQLFLYLQTKYSSDQSKLLYLEDFVRNGKWWKNTIPEIANYNNLILVGMGGIGVPLGGFACDVGIILWTFGIMNETAEITLTNFRYTDGGTSNLFDAYLYDDNKFIQNPINTGFVRLTHRQNMSSDDYSGWKGTAANSYSDGTKAYIDNRIIGTTANMRELLNIGGNHITNDSGTIRLTNLIGGTI